jgi:hypothetical protein
MHYVLPWAAISSSWPIAPMQCEVSPNASPTSHLSHLPGHIIRTPTRRESPNAHAGRADHWSGNPSSTREKQSRAPSRPSYSTWEVGTSMWPSGNIDHFRSVRPLTCTSFFSRRVNGWEKDSPLFITRLLIIFFFSLGKTNKWIHRCQRGGLERAVEEPRPSKHACQVRTRAGALDP